MTKKKMVAITGAAGALGQALTKEFLARDYSIWAIDRDQDGGKALKALAPDQIHFTQIDLSNRLETLHTLSQSLNDMSAPDIWINNAGMAITAPFLETSHEDWMKVIDLNFTVTAYLCRFWIEQMKSNGGTIVNIASVAGHIPTTDLSSYVASKHAVVGLTRSLQFEMELYSIPVKMVLVSPGFFKSNLINFGKKYGFPPQLAFLLETPEKVAKNIVSALLKGKDEIGPTRSGNMMMALARHFPATGRTIGKKIYQNVKSNWNIKK